MEGQPEGQVKALEADGEGGIQFSEAGQAALLDLVNNAPEAGAKEPPKAEEPPKEEKPPETPPEPPKVEPQKFKIKVDGKEEELPVEELISRAQMGTDYTRKTQALAERDRQLAPYEGLVKQLQTDPKLNEHLRAYYNPPPKQQEPPKPPDDPVEKLKWEIEQSLLQKMQGVIQPTQEQLAQTQHQQVIQRTMMQVQADPLYPDVHKAMREHLETLPGEISDPQSTRGLVFLQWDQNPDAFLKSYQHYRTQVEKSKQAKPPETKVTENATRTEHAPILESSGTSAPTSQAETEKKQRLSKAKTRAMREGSVDALADFLKEGDFLKHLA